MFDQSSTPEIRSKLQKNTQRVRRKFVKSTADGVLEVLAEHK